jgi:Uri superfamily endonuclease
LKKQENGVYILILKLKEDQRLSAGKLPETNFKSGIYLYVGRARHSLQERLRRHLRKEKKLFWHIDYFLQKATIEEAWIKRDFFDECQTALEVKNFFSNSLYPQKKFGSSDCSCTSHLIYLPRNKRNLECLRKKLSFEKVNIHGNKT